MVRQPRYTVIDSAGIAVAGDDRLDGHLKGRADLSGGAIIDRGGVAVYTAATPPAPTTEEAAE